MFNLAFELMSDKKIFGKFRTISFKWFLKCLKLPILNASQENNIFHDQTYYNAKVSCNRWRQEKLFKDILYLPSIGQMAKLYFNYRQKFNRTQLFLGEEKNSNLTWHESIGRGAKSNLACAGTWSWYRSYCSLKNVWVLCFA